MSNTLDAISSLKSKAANPCQHLFSTVLMNMKNKPDVDWKLVAEKAGYKSAVSAQETFRYFMRKFKGVSRPIDGPTLTPQSHTDTTDAFGTLVSTSQTSSKEETVKPKSNSRKRNFSSENDESGGGKKKRTKKEIGSAEESNVLVQRVKQERRARIAVLDDSDEYAEG